MLALGKYKARKYEKGVYDACIDDGRIVWEALQSLFEINSPYLVKAIEKAKTHVSKEPDVKESRRLLEAIGKKYDERQSR